MLPLLRLLPPWLGVALGAVGALSAWSGLRRPLLPGALRAVLALAIAGVVLAAYGFRFGRDSGSALLLAMLALKLAETRTLRDGRSLIGFALFAAFAAFLQDQGPLTLALAAPAALLMLAASQRLADAEAAVPFQTPEAVAPRLRRTAGVLALALPLALAGFWLFPRLPSPLWGVPENALARTGIDDRMAPGDWLDLMTDDSVAFRVRFEGRAPAPREMYWRGPVLWNFDGRAWSRWDGYAYLPPPRVRAAGATLRYEITLEPTDRRFLFALDVPLAVPANGRLGMDLSPLAQRPLRSLTRYALRSAPAARFDTVLRPIYRDMALRLPEGYNPRTLALARRWRDEGADDAEVIRHALAMYNRDFIYTLGAPPLGRHSVDEFLFETREGYCEHFSASFTTLMRAAGIPARVVTGYAGAYRNPLGDYWVVRQSDAHAWSEVWLPGRGWLRVDPTAAVAPERVFETVSELGAIAAMRPVWDMGDWLRRGWNDFALGFDAARQQLLLRPLGIARASAWQIGTAFGVVAALALGFTFLMLLRDRGPARDPLLAAWNRFCGRFARTAQVRATYEPPLAWAARAAAARPQDAPALFALSGRFAVWRYAGRELDAAARKALIRDLRRFRPRRRGGNR